MRGPLLGEDNDRRVRQAELEIAVARADLGGLADAGAVERIEQVRVSEVGEESQLDVDAEPGQDQVVGLGGGEGRDDELAWPGRQRLARGEMIGVAPVGGSVENARVYDQRARREPSSWARIASASRPTACPVPRPAP